MKGQEEIVAELVAKGGKVWEKGEIFRVYFNDFLSLAGVCEMEFSKKGHCVGAKLDQNWSDFFKSLGWAGWKLTSGEVFIWDSCKSAKFFWDSKEGFKLQSDKNFVSASEKENLLPCFEEVERRLIEALS